MKVAKYSLALLFQCHVLLKTTWQLNLGEKHLVSKEPHIPRATNPWLLSRM